MNRCPLPDPVTARPPNPEVEKVEPEQAPLVTSSLYTDELPADALPRFEARE